MVTSGVRPQQTFRTSPDACSSSQFQRAETATAAPSLADYLQGMAGARLGEAVGQLQLQSAALAQQRALAQHQQDAMRGAVNLRPLACPEPIRSKPEPAPTWFFADVVITASFLGALILAGVLLI